jgi:hypothetical protein
VWRSCPCLAEFRLYEQFRLDESWDSPLNLALLAEIPDVYAPEIGRDRMPHATFYQAIVGPGAPFDGEEGARIADSIYVASPALILFQ